MEESYNDCLALQRTNHPIYLTRRRSKRFKSPEKRRIRRTFQRLIKKSGHTTVNRTTIPQRSYRYILDIANTFIASRWECTLIAVSLAFLSTWIIFACFWMLIALVNGDLDTENKTVKPCLSGIQSFAGYLLFSIETQTSIGYGSRTINHHCPEAILLLGIQVVVGLCICGGLMGVVYTKMSRPQKLHSLCTFSKHAVIHQRDGQLRLIFRLRDPVKRFESHTKIAAYLVGKRDEDIFLKHLPLETLGILLWPTEVVHTISETSPFWDLSAKDLLMKRFEVVITIEGESNSTCSVSFGTASYLSTEILWGRRFKNCVNFDKSLEAYVINHRIFNQTEEVSTSLCSAKRLQEVMSDISEECQQYRECKRISPISAITKMSESSSENRDRLSDNDSGRYTISPVMVHRADMQENDNKIDKDKMSKNQDVGKFHIAENEEYVKSVNDAAIDKSTSVLLKSLEQFIIQKVECKNSNDEKEPEPLETAF